MKVFILIEQCCYSSTVVSVHASQKQADEAMCAFLCDHSKHSIGHYGMFVEEHTVESD